MDTNNHDDDSERDQHDELNARKGQDGSGGNTPLCVAAQLGDLQSVKSLLHQGAPVNASNSAGFTPLHLAAEAGHISVVEALLDSKADIQARGPYNQRAVDFSIRNGHSEVTKLLQKRETRSSLWVKFLEVLANI